MYKKQVELLLPILLSSVEGILNKIFLVLFKEMQRNGYMFFFLKTCLEFDENENVRLDNQFCEEKKLQSCMKILLNSQVM